jgi:hypothetical protein
LSGVECFCCGEQRESAELTALRCHPEVQVCRSCIGWLVEQSGSVDVTPTLPVLDMDLAVDFYESVGFQVHVYEGGGFAFVSLKGRSVFTSAWNLSRQAPGPTWSSPTRMTGTLAFKPRVWP